MSDDILKSKMEELQEQSSQTTATLKSVREHADHGPESLTWNTLEAVGVASDTAEPSEKYWRLMRKIKDGD